MASDSVVIVQLPRGGAVDWYLRTYPPSGVASGQVVMSVLSPEALARDQQEVRDVIQQAPDDAGPLVIIVEAAEQLREDELAVVVDAAARARRDVVVRVMADA